MSTLGWILYLISCTALGQMVYKTKVIRNGFLKFVLGGIIWFIMTGIFGIIFSDCPYNGDIDHDAKVLADKFRSEGVDKAMDEAMEIYVEKGWGLYRYKEMTGEVYKYMHK